MAGRGVVLMAKKMWGFQDISHCMDQLASITNWLIINHEINTNHYIFGVNGIVLQVEREKSV